MGFVLIIVDMYCVLYDCLVVLLWLGMVFCCLIDMLDFDYVVVWVDFGVCVSDLVFL